MKIALLGYGKMGKEIENHAKKRNHEISFILDKKFEDGKINNSDVAINFSIPEAAVSNIKLALERNIPVVSGTTGWLNDYDSIISFCQKKKGAFLYAPNFSIGVNLFFKINQYLASLMNKYDSPFNISIEETHHKEKVDSPSGTAISLANDIIEKNNSFISWGKNKNSKSISMISKRQNKKIGVHKVSFESKLDKLQIQHEAFSRDSFAKGSIIAAKWIQNKKGIFNMDDILGF